MQLKEKSWSKEMEKPIYEKWKGEKAYGFDRKSDKRLYSIDTPPPYVNTPIHIGHATTYTMMDFFARFKRMTGFNVLFPLGLDRNGLPIEMAAEKKFKVSLKDVTREEFIRLCEKILEESSHASIESFLRLGISFNSWEVGKEIGNIYLTDSERYRALTQATFIDLWNKGMIYEGTYLTSYCPGCRTTIADSEVEYKEMPTMLNNVRFKLKGSDKEIIIATTRPELLCTAAMVIFHPDDDRYKSLEGKIAIVPIYNIEVPIKAHPVANPEFGTGLVFMSKSAGDQNAIRFLREMNIEPEMAVNEQGRMKNNSGFLEGMKTKEAREKIIEELRGIGFLESQQQIMHRTPVCERSKDVIEYIMVPELYLKQLELKKEMLEIADKISVFAESSRQILLDWIDCISIDWPVSRRRYYATEVPLWHCRKCNETIVPKKGGYYRPWKESSPVEKCDKCGSGEFEGDKRVLDTWFDSSISPLYILDYPNDFFQKHKICTLRPQGKEIVRTWLYYTLLRCYQLTKNPIFKDVWIHYHVVDEHGKKMSKSVGNVLDPKIILDKYGAEPFRLWCAVEGNIAETDLRCSFERIEGAGKTLTKLWNVARFVSQFQQDSASPVKLTDTDRWIMQEINELVKHSHDCYEKYDFHSPATKIKHFLWETFASHYIELAKSRAYNPDNKFTKEEQDSAIFALNHCLDLILKLLAPIVPMLTYKIYSDLRGKDVHGEKFPEAEKEFSVAFSTEELAELNGMIWKAKKDKGISLKSEINELALPERFKTIEKDIIATHGVKKIRYDKIIEIIILS